MASVIFTDAIPVYKLERLLNAGRVRITALKIVVNVMTDKANAEIPRTAH